MEYLIYMALLVGGIWLSVILMQRAKGKKLTDQIREEQDAVVWAAAQRAALLVRSRDVVEAQRAADAAKNKLRIAATCRSVHDYEHACVDVRLAEGDLQYAIGRNASAQRVYSLVSALYSSVLTECLSHPKRAMRIYPTLKARVETIVQTEVQARPVLKVIRGGKDEPITKAELFDFKTALHDGRVDDWVRDLKI